LLELFAFDEVNIKRRRHGGIKSMGLGREKSVKLGKRHKKGRFFIKTGLS
jgi:hypothetical protein